MKKTHTTRFLSLILALVMSLSLCVPAAAGDTVQFTDVSEDHWAYDSIIECADWGIISGYPDGRFGPDDSMTIAQFVTMIVRTFYPGMALSIWSPPDAPWYYSYAKAAHELMLDERLPEIDDTPMVRYDMAMLLDYVYFKEQASVTREPYYTQKEAIAQIGDIVDVLDYTGVGKGLYEVAVVECFQYGLLSGMSDGCFHGEQTMTRAQACVVLLRLMDLLGKTR